MMNVVKLLFQVLFSPFLANGKKSYQEGLSTLICCKNEEFNITPCLESVSSFSDQIICIDNGSTDETLKLIRAFGKKKSTQVALEIIDGANLTLCEARNLGLSHVKHNWLLHSGGDFVYHTNGPNAFKHTFRKLSNSKRYQSWRLGFIDLFGDFHHTYKSYPVKRLGENYLYKMHPNLKFVEEGKFDYLKLPKYYLNYTHQQPVFFHLDGMKSDDRLIYRNAYFEWRQLLNSSKTDEFNSINNFDFFFKHWVFELFGTNDPLKLKFRFQRQLAELYYERYDSEQYMEYPETIRKIISEKKERFFVVYKNNKPYLRTDIKDEDMVDYEPDQSDLDWSIPDYFKKYKAKDYLQIIKQKMLS